MYRFVLFVTVCVLTTPMLTAGAVGASEEVTVSVHVVDDDGDDVAGATVTATWDGGEETETTAANGQTLIDVPNGADVSITVEDDALVQNNPREIGTVRSHTDVTVELFPETTATVTVTDGEAAIDGATVTLTRTDDDRAAATGTTDGDGEVTAEGIEEGRYDVVVERTGYYDESAVVDFATTDEASVELESGTVDVSVTVTDSYLDAPLETDVGFYKDGDHDATVSTDEDGQRTIPLDVNTKYTAVVEKDGYGEPERTVDVGESDRTVSYEIERAPAVTLESTNERVLVGETVGVGVTDEYGEPIEGAEVRLDGEAVATTAADGSATVPIDEAGDRELTAVTEDTTAETVTVEGVDPDADDGTVEGDETDEQAETETDETDDSVPGFGALVAAAALAATMLVYSRR
ncbi:carboxypeptidase-like regulatory domain-containing protein [Halosolutus amylolyticus]|uniref:Carboxypeptidase-like regulatory domain-containing protein n=1 Tax=Halosolutus amylolyticus TaxID=2932267 RepID=A0ABD5PT88_9EURY|nr:carboxypeptidase-like regulatory domain-containing protein [Halosolutus amylolyticus]